MNSIFLKINLPTETTPPTVESTRPDLRPDELAWVFRELGIKKLSKRNLARERNGEKEITIPFDKIGRSIYYKVEDIDKWLREWWEREQRSDR
jgi:hypothetical protein